MFTIFSNDVGSQRYNWAQLVVSSYFYFEEGRKASFCAGHFNFLDIPTIFYNQNTLAQYQGIMVAEYHA